MKIAFTCFLLVSCLHFSLGEEIKEILLLNSYHTGYKWTNDLTNGVIDGIGNPNKNRIFVEYMDFKRFQQKDYFYELSNLYKYKYSELELDGIICADNYAFQFLLEKGDSIWNKKIPVFACGVNNIETFEFDTHRIKAIKEEIDIKNTLEFIIKLQPELDSIIIISDQTLSGKIFLNQFINGLKNFKPTLPYIVMDGTDYIKINTDLKQISPKNKAIILLSLYSINHEIPIEMKVLAHELLKDINIPTYSFWDFLLGDLIVGGSLISGYDQGYEAGKLLLQRLEDKNINIPTFTNSKYKNTFDFNLIKKYNLDYKTLPDSVLFINKEVPFWIKFKKQLIYILFTLLLLLIANILLISNIILKKRVELKLLESEKRLELALDSSNQGLWDVLVNERKVIYNDNLARLLGYKNTSNLNINIKNWRSFINKEDIPQIKEAFLLHLNGITPLFKCEIQLYKKDNNLHNYAIYGKITERNINRKAIRITGILMDIASQKEFETQLKIAKTKAEESDRLKSSFLANMSHEIRTPMNAILGFSDILYSQDLTKHEQEMYLSQIRNSGENLLNIINDIVDISKIESGQLTIRNEKFDLNKLLDNLEITGIALIKSKRKTIKLVISKMEPNSMFFIYSDPFRLEQILLNLLSNAIKFTHEGTITISYTLSGDNKIIFKVSDTGEGIAIEDQVIIFERFRQAEKSSKNLLSGTGLGLSITQSLVKMLNGTIKVESKIDQGSVFTVELPHHIHLMKE